MTSGRIVYIILLIGVFLFFVFKQDWIFFFLFLLLIGIAVISLIGLLISAKKTTIRINAAKSVIRGGCGELNICCDCSSVFPFAHALIAVNIADNISPMPSQFYIISPGENISIPFFTDHCTCVHFTFRKCCLCDMLGLFTLRRPQPQLCSLVLPRPAAIVPKPKILNGGERTTTAKSGSGFSEIYEVRDYRPGDRLRDVHWKLSAKYDKYVVREPQETLERLVTIAVDIGSTPEENDFILDRLSYLAGQLLAEETDMTIMWTRPDNEVTDSIFVNDNASLRTMWQNILAVPIGSYRRMPVYPDSNSPSFFHLKGFKEAEQ